MAVLRTYSITWFIASHTAQVGELICDPDLSDTKSMFLIMLHNGSKGKEGTIPPPVLFYSGRLQAGKTGSAARLDCSSGRGDSHLAIAGVAMIPTVHSIPR